MARYLTLDEASGIPDLTAQELSDFLQLHNPKPCVAALCQTLLEGEVSGHIFVGLKDNDFDLLGFKDVFARRWILSAITTCSQCLENTSSAQEPTAAGTIPTETTNASGMQNAIHNHTPCAFDI